MKTIAILGYPGAGKTWVVNEFMKHVRDKLGLIDRDNEVHNVGLVKYHTIGHVTVVGYYDGSKFQGTDRLSMAVAPHFESFFHMVKSFDDVKPEEIVIAEGDRINCMPFFRAAQSRGELIRIKLNTDQVTLKQRRDQRNHVFPQSFLKTVATKVDKHTFDHVMNSEQLLNHLKQLV